VRQRIKGGRRAGAEHNCRPAACLLHGISSPTSSATRIECVGAIAPLPSATCLLPTVHTRRPSQPPRGSPKSIPCCSHPTCLALGGKSFAADILTRHCSSVLAMGIRVDGVYTRSYSQGSGGCEPSQRLRQSPTSPAIVPSRPWIRTGNFIFPTRGRSPHAIDSVCMSGGGCSSIRAS
jgi:hypothetical protein